MIYAAHHVLYLDTLHRESEAVKKTLVDFRGLSVQGTAFFKYPEPILHAQSLEPDTGSLPSLCVSSRLINIVSGGVYVWLTLSCSAEIHSLGHFSFCGVIYLLDTGEDFVRFPCFVFAI